MYIDAYDKSSQVFSPLWPPCSPVVLFSLFVIISIGNGMICSESFALNTTSEYFKIVIHNFMSC